MQKPIPHADDLDTICAACGQWMVIGAVYKIAPGGVVNCRIDDPDGRHLDCI